MTAPRRLRGCLMNTAVLGGATLVALGIAELTIRLVAPQQVIQVRPDIWEAADSVGWVNRPNVQTTINTGEGSVHFYTDAAGMRVGRPPHPDAPTRVLVIGDSFMEALQVEYEQSFPALLEAGLPALIGRPVTVHDAGVDGWDPPQYLIRTRQLLDRGRWGAVVVALYLGNDIVRRRPAYIPPRAPVVQHKLRLPRRVGWGEFVDAALRPLNDALKMRSQLYILLRARLHTVLMHFGLTGEYFPEELRKTEATSPRWDVTADLCRDIAAAGSRHGVPTLFVLVPTPFALDSATFDQARTGFGLRPEDVDLDQPTKKMVAALGARGLAFLDVLPGFRAAAAQHRALYGNVDRHLTPAGHDLLTRLVLPRVAAMLAARPGAVELRARRSAGN